jgi:hypothetical protein
LGERIEVRGICVLAKQAVKELCRLYLSSSAMSSKKYQFTIRQSVPLPGGAGVGTLRCSRLAPSRCPSVLVPLPSRTSAPQLDLSAVAASRRRKPWRRRIGGAGVGASPFPKTSSPLGESRVRRSGVRRRTAHRILAAIQLSSTVIRQECGAESICLLGSPQPVTVWV